MSGFFNVDNVFFTAMSKICDIIMLSIVYVVLCIPIITIGPATTALYYTVVKVIRRERGYIFREFFKSFKQNFKSGFIVTIILIAAYFILYIDRQYASSMMEVEGAYKTYGTILWCIFNAIAIILMCVTVYLFPVLSRFTLKGKEIFKTSAFMAIRHLPSTFLVVVIVVASILLVATLPILFLCLPAVSCLLVSFLIERVFKKYMPKSEGDPEETGKDEWYLE